MVRFTDFRAGVKYEYDSKAKSLSRLPVSGEAAESFQSMSALFRGLLRGESPQGDRFAEDRIVGRKEHSVEENGQKWLDYELELQRGKVTATVVIRVQPETKLPVSMTVVVPGGSVKFEFDYPAEGPTDIYALGVPRDTPVDDRMPPADLAEIIRSLNMGCRDLDNYFAVVSGALPERFVWRKGDKWFFQKNCRKMRRSCRPGGASILPDAIHCHSSFVTDEASKAARSSRKTASRSGGNGKSKRRYPRETLMRWQVHSGMPAIT
jgi:hypothetical protein